MALALLALEAAIRSRYPSESSFWAGAVRRRGVCRARFGRHRTTDLEQGQVRDLEPFGLTHQRVRTEQVGSYCVLQSLAGLLGYRQLTEPDHDE